MIFFLMMWFNVNFINLVLASLGLVLSLLTVLLYWDYLVFKSRYFKLWFKNFVWFALLVTTIGSVFISLLYSEYFGFVPCSLCWLQRIALYPQALFAVMAFKTKESVYYPLYSLALSVFGLLVSLYQYIDQMLPKDVTGVSILPCLTDGTSDCALKVIDEFGFVTFPFLSAVTFAFLIILYLNLRREVKSL